MTEMTVIGPLSRSGLDVCISHAVLVVVHQRSDRAAVCSYLYFFTGFVGLEQTLDFIATGIGLTTASIVLPR
jgi:hypothetical protein